MSKRRADSISNGIFLIGLGILAYTDWWWPGILLVLWATLAVRQYFTGRFYDLGISTLILVGLFVIYYLQFDLSVLIPVLLILAGIHLIFREYCFTAGIEEDEDLIEEEEKDVEDRDGSQNKP